ncbi:hypothetical protein FRX31_002181 [Thalictrum thalictroides]|uniref:Uncharacterized protein n=1 Tax=Thalictrum thalictroides TaxID=46969 RepID=A0A7J6XER6_THATH|nr:hypothetical protein FRX31_002181 [Thalictrum thalictroides]
MTVEEIVLDELPCWIGFSNLLLEHMNANIVGMVAAAAGEVITVVPDKDLPRVAKSFRARVKLNPLKPFAQGGPANTLTRDDVWINFTYIDIPATLCKKVLQIGSLHKQM